MVTLEELNSRFNFTKKERLEEYAIMFDLEDGIKEMNLIPEDKENLRNYLWNNLFEYENEYALRTKRTKDSLLNKRMHFN